MMSIGLSEQGRWFDQRRRYSFAAGQLAGNAAGVDRSTDGRVSPRDRFAISWPPAHLVCLWTLLLFVAAASVHDVALVVLNHEVILHFEQNPVGRWLIEANGGAVWLFAGVKLFSTAVVCSLLVTLHAHRRRMGLVVAGGLATFQACLMIYLTSN